MASGRHPFECDSIPATLHCIAYDDPPPLATVRPEFPASFTRIVGRLLDTHPEKRPGLSYVLSELHPLERVD